MANKKLGITFRETMTGPFALGETEPAAGEAAGKKAKTTLALHATIEIDSLDDFVADKGHNGKITGSVDFPPIGSQMTAPRGVFRLFSPSGQKDRTLMVYELSFDHQGQPYYLAGQKEVENNKSGTDMLKDTTTLFTRLHKGADKTAPVIGAGVLSLGVPDLAKMVSTMKVLNASTPAEQLHGMTTFGRFFMGSLWDTYGPKSA